MKMIVGQIKSITFYRFEKNICEARIKDLERLSWVLGIFNYDPDTPIYHKILESLRDPIRETEMAL